MAIAIQSIKPGYTRPYCQMETSFLQKPEMKLGIRKYLKTIRKYSKSGIKIFENKNQKIFTIRNQKIFKTGRIRNYLNSGIRKHLKLRESGNI